METYPGELLVGVFPLVFCVDATLAKSKEESSSSDNAPGTPTSGRSQFDRFLDAMAASLMDDPEDSHPLQMDDPTHPTPQKDGMMSLFRGDEDDDDSDAEDESLLYDPTSSTMPSNNAPNTPMMPSANTGSFQSPVTSFDASLSPVPGRPRSFSGMGIRLPSMSRSTSRSFSNNNNNNKDEQYGLNTSYAKALEEGQGFFQRARIVSISAKHGFPPSKDAQGENNRMKDFMGPKNTIAIPKILSGTKNRPLDGILPSGWLEKHAHALPSALLVVVEVMQDQNQFEQDHLLLSTLEHLQLSLASKRNCTIQVVGLVQEGVSQILAEQWSQTIADKLQGQELTMLPVSDLQQDAPPSMGLKHLHKSVKEASLQYYHSLAKHTKHKLMQLGPTRKTPMMLPLSIRYYFKVAMLYEFQWKQEKSIKFLVEAYRHVETYYRYLLQQRALEDPNDNNADPQTTDGKDPSKDAQDKPVKIRVGNQALENTGGGESEGVELSLQSPTNASSADDDDTMMLLKPPTPPEDMVHQCRAVADWLNFKILQSGFMSHTEGGLMAASTQWQRHAHAFCSPRRSFVCSPNHAWLDWSFVAHQRMVVSQLLERNPPKALGGLGNDFDEVLLRCSPWRTYEAAAEALLKLGYEVQKSAGTIVGGVEETDKMRTRYVGGLDSTGYTPKLQEEVQVNHRG